MNITKLISLLLLICITNTSFAQDSTKTNRKWSYSLGFYINVSLRGQKPVKTILYEYGFYKPAIGSSASFEVMYQVNSLLFFKTGINYDNINYKYGGEIGYRTRITSVRNFHYASIPIGIGLKVGKNVNIDFSPRYRLLFDGKERGTFYTAIDVFNPYNSQSSSGIIDRNISNIFVKSEIDVSIGITVKLFQLFNQDIAFSLRGTKSFFGIGDKSYVRDEYLSSGINIVF